MGSTRWPPFVWLRNKRHRRSALRSVERAIRAGRLDEAPAEHRAALVAESSRLIEAPGLSHREVIRAVRVVAAMMEADARPKMHRPPKAPLDAG